MVGGRQVLLSIAVLSSLGFDSVFGGRLGRRDGAVDTVQSATGGGDASSSTSSPADVVSLLESTGTATATIAIAASTSEDPTGSTPEGEGTSAAGFGPQAIDSSRRPEATAQANAVLSASTEDDYVDPGGFGAGGTLTTDTRAPTRSAEPTMSSVDPGAQTSRGPPPAETRTSSSRVPATRPGNPVADDTGYTYGPGQAAPETAAQATTAAQAEATPPRGGPPGKPPTRVSSEVTKQTTETVDLGYDSPSTSEASDAGNASQTTFVTSTRYANETFTYRPSVSISYCKASDLIGAPTTWSVVHTSTVTWYGNPKDYTPPYTPISVPQTTESCVVPVEPPRLTISVCASTGTGTKYMTCEVTTTTESLGYGIQTSYTPSVVFLTTDKNPAVVFTSIRTPNYGVSQGPKSNDNHASPTDAGGGGAISTPIYNSQDPPPPQAVTDPEYRPTATPITVAVQPTAVVINGNTIRDNPAQPTQVVIIADQTFTIDPTRVVGAGATVDRPSATGGVYVPVPTSTNLGGIPVVISSSVAVIGGSSFTLNPTATTTATISGQTFTIGPSTIAGASQTLPLPTLPRPTEVVVAGGDLVTAIGRSVLVIHGTTLTYSTGGSDPTKSTVLTIDGDDVLTLGPGGVTAHGGSLTMGGSHASSPQDTQYALVGGATITKIGASVVVIRDVTYTVGPGSGTTTTVVGGQSVTIMPRGVEVGSLTLGFPFGPTTVITPGAGAGSGAAAATSGGGGGAGGGTTGGGEDAEEDAASGGVRPWLVGVVWGVGVAVGVGVVMG
ncbi:hypothetical protein C8A00DRAFT_40366 [Chaetomidium leptoderma]|uniref:Uncharacterized protein n=1 Tax=Chaetomidium leptoderma TaxID=669021 RepID=A0AAN6VUV5_9PEZI|nr:hypothetical protein C8A00DRAFT_40366 [Chaetomidium leptoderma]